MDEIYFSEFFHTKSQANDFLIRLNEISDKIYQTGFNIDTELTNNFGIEKKENFLRLLRNHKINPQSASGLKEFINKILEKISAIPVLSLTIAFEPNQETLNKLSEWFILNASKEVVFEIKVNPKIVGGATINFNGQFKDYSIKETFDHVVLNVLTQKANITPNQSTQPSQTIKYSN
jgi:hypothetical protein